MSNDLIFYAKQRGFFDYDWYIKTYGDVFDSELSAFNDFLRKSVFSRVFPSENFDPLMYFLMNPDVYEAQMSPLEHYLIHGEKEGRLFLGKQEIWDTDKKINSTVGVPSHKGKYAIVLHIFYEDFVYKFSDALSGADFSYDLFLTVSSQGIADFSRNYFLANHPNINNIFISVCPNKGRNFGPFLVEFSKKIMEYDFFCHLHSKKSLYSGREQSQWADYQIEYLLRDKKILSKTLSIFESQPEYGLFYPTNFFMMPPWVNHWLKNKSKGREFLARFSIEDYDEFFAYPVGGMFWARPKAIKEILSYDWKYEDFPDEPLPADGTILHVLERVLPKISEANGFKQFFYYPSGGFFSDDQSYIYQGYYSHEEILREKIRESKIVSFDIFDTLVKRDFYEPDFAKFILPQKLGLSIDPMEYVKLRNLTELSLRKINNFVGDVDIYEIYEEMAKFIDFPSGYKDAADCEFEIDLEHISVKDVVLDIFQKCVDDGKIIFLISDTYYVDRQIRLILNKVGVKDNYNLYISSSLKLRKDNGTMWDYIKKYLQSVGCLDSFLHIGDNVEADVQNPSDRGISSIHILSPMHKWKSLGLKSIEKEFSLCNIDSIFKWGPLLSQIGSNPFYCKFSSG